MAPMRTSAVLIPLMLSAALYAVLPAFRQVPLSDVEALEGPWEYTSPGGIKGIFIRAEAAVIHGTDTPMIDWQNVSICVYHRPHGQSQDTQCFAPPAYNRFVQMLPRDPQRTPFVGDWVSNPDPAARRPPSTGSLHIRESSDGVFDSLARS